MPQTPKQQASPAQAEARNILHCTDAAAWHAWLAAHCDDSPAIWLKITKKSDTASAQTASLTYQQALDIALCFGWIDGQKDKLDAQFWLQRFSQRNDKSPWSQINRDKIESLTQRGLMQPRGLEEVRKAKADGRWHAAYAPSSNFAIPPDFIAALQHDAAALRFFESLNRANLFAIYYRLHSAKKPETRQKRFDMLVAMMKAGKKLHEGTKKSQD